MSTYKIFVGESEVPASNYTITPKPTNNEITVTFVKLPHRFIGPVKIYENGDLFASILRDIHIYSDDAITIKY